MNGSYKEYAMLTNFRTTRVLVIALLAAAAWTMSGCASTTSRNAPPISDDNWYNSAGGFSQR